MFTVPIWFSTSAVMDFRGDGPRRLLDQIDAPRVERPLVHPDDFSLELGADRRRLERQRVAAADVDLVVQRQRHRHRRECVIELAVVGDDAADAGGAAGRRRDDRDRRRAPCPSNLSGVAAEFLVRPQHELHGKPEGEHRQIARHLHGLEDTRAGSARRTTASGRCA